MNKKFLFGFFIWLIIMGFVSGADIDKNVLAEFRDGAKKVNVIVEKNQDFSKIKIIETSPNIERIAERENKFSAYVSQDELRELELDPGVSSIRRNIPLKIFMQDVVGIVEANKTWPLQINNINLTGLSKSVCILDTGANTSHPDLVGKILAEKCFCTVSDSGSGGCCPSGTMEEDDAEDDEGHGTHIAGIVGASGGIEGMATNVGLVIVKIMNGTGEGNSNDLEDGMQWCIDNAATYNISAITASLGDPSTKYTTSCNPTSPTTTLKINVAVEQNISVTIASGNNGWSDGITWPSCIANATPVGAVTKTDSLIYNRNSLVKIFGIGQNVNSTDYGGSYSLKSGTSMATPVVAGVIAILTQFLNLTNQMKTPSEIEDVLYDTGKNIVEGANNYSRINIYSAILSLDNIAPNVSLISPTDSEINDDLNETFLCNVTDEIGLSNITLYLWNSTNDLINQTVANLSGTSNESSFNITNLQPGNYKWNCKGFDQKGNSAFANSNFSLIINNLSISLNSPLNNSYTNQNKTFNCSAKTLLGHNLINITFYLWNSTGNLVYNLSQNLSGIFNSTIFNYNFTNESLYSWNCEAHNNQPESSFASSNYTIIYDLSYPNITLGSPEDSSLYTSNSQEITFSYNVTENYGLSNCSLIIGEAISLTNSSIVNLSLTQSFMKIFTPGSYNWKINCTDLAGNENDSSQRSFSVIAPPIQPSGGGGGGGVSSQTYDLTPEQIVSGYTKDLSKNDKIKFTFFDGKAEQHTLIVNSVGEDFANLTIQSDSINLLLGVGQSAKLNMTSPDYYDLYIKLEDIVNSKAKITIQLIYEEIPRPITGEVIDIKIMEDQNKTEEEIGRKINSRDIIFSVLLLIAIITIILLFLKQRIEISKKKKI